MRTEAKKPLPIFHPKKSKLRAQLHKLQDKDKLAFDHPKVEKLKKKIVAVKESYYDPDEDYYDPIDGVGFASPGSNSALRAATKHNPRIYPCPTCGRRNMLTRIDKARGYQCDNCADELEGGFGY